MALSSIQHAEATGENRLRYVAIVAAIVLTALLPRNVSAATERIVSGASERTNSAFERCEVTVRPAVGSPTQVFRIIVNNVPIDPTGGSVEVDVVVQRIHSSGGTIYFAFVVPFGTKFYIDHNQSFPGEPQSKLAEGRYVISVTTPHIAKKGCHSSGAFIVTQADD